MQLIQAYQLKENELESYRRLLEMHGIWVSFYYCVIYDWLEMCWFGVKSATMTHSKLFVL